MAHALRKQWWVIDAAEKIVYRESHTYEPRYECWFSDGSVRPGPYPGVPGKDLFETEYEACCSLIRQLSGDVDALYTKIARLWRQAMSQDAEP